MKKEEFTIPIAGLKDKVYHFEYELEESFFDPANEPLVSAPVIRLHISFDKTNEPYVLHFHIEGDFGGECDRCGSPVRIPIEGTYRLFVEFGQPETNSDETEVIYISRDDHEIRLYEHVRDFVYLSIPMVKRCSAPEDIARCNETVKAFLKQVPTVERKTDPRWEALKKLK
jgi:uncharacterized metal-binding protein YceD (DUF177 family)